MARRAGRALSAVAIVLTIAGTAAPARADEPTPTGTDGDPVETLLPTFELEPSTLRSSEGELVPIDLAQLANGDATRTFEIAWGDSSAHDRGSVSDRAVVRHRYLDDGRYRGMACVRDAADRESCREFVAIVANVDPRVVLRSGPGSFEGGPATIVVDDIVDPGTDVHALTVDWGDGETAAQAVATLGARLTHTYPAEGSYVAEVCVIDDDGGRGCAEQLVQVANAPPSLALAWSDGAPGEADTIYAGEPFELPSLSVLDAGNDAVSVTVDWGDGSAPEELPARQAWADVQHEYRGPGEYSISVCATDADGASTCTALSAFVTREPFASNTLVRISAVMVVGLVTLALRRLLFGGASQA